MKKIKIFTFLIIVFVITWLLLPQYLKKALIYMGPGIEDYSIFENREIDAGYYQPWKISSQYNKIKIDSSFLKTFDSLETVAYIVIKDDSLLHEEYWDGYSDSSLSNSFSVAKSVVGLLIGIAFEEGKIDSLDQKVGDFIPEFKLGLNQQLTIRHLLTMSSGLDWEETYKSPVSITTKAYYGENLEELLRNTKLSRTPGTFFKYQSGNTELLAMIIEKASGMYLSNYASEKLWKPLGAKHMALWSLDHANGLEKAYCCINSNAPDLARIGQLVINKGKWNNRQIISDSLLKIMLCPSIWLTDDHKQVVDYYGYHWWMLSYKGMDVKYARGILGQYIIVIPSKNLVIVRLGHKRDVKKNGMHPFDLATWIDAGLELSNF